MTSFYWIQLNTVVCGTKLIEKRPFILMFLWVLHLFTQVIRIKFSNSHNSTFNLSLWRMSSVSSTRIFPLSKLLDFVYWTTPHLHATHRSLLVFFPTKRMMAPFAMPRMSKLHNWNFNAKNSWWYKIFLKKYYKVVKFLF